MSILANLALKLTPRALTKFDSPDLSKVLGLSTTEWTNIVNWRQAYNRGIRFTVIKALNGVNSVKFWRQNYEGAKAAGILVGISSQLYSSSKVPIGRQARLFAQMMRDYPTDLPPCIGFQNTNSKKPVISDLLEYVKIFESAYGSKPMIFTTPGYWKQYGSTDEIWADYPLWQAQYDKGLWSNIPPWPGYTFLQWTKKGQGKLYGVPAFGERTVELNYWRGTYDELLTYRIEKSFPPEEAESEGSGGSPMLYAPQWARLRHDDPPRNTGLLVAPETVTMLDQPKGPIKGDRVKISPAWLKWISTLQTKNAFNWLLKTGSMWVNVPSKPDGTVLAEPIGCGGNVVKVIAKLDEYSRLEVLNANHPPPVRQSLPDLPQIVVVTTKFFHLLQVRDAPGTSAKILDYYKNGRALTVTKYEQIDDDIWGKVDKGWIALRYKGDYYTNWQIKTNVLQIDYINTPWLVHRAVAVHSSPPLRIYKVGSGLDVYFPLASSRPERWIENYKLEFFPSLPQALIVIAGGRQLPIYAKPDESSEILGQFTDQQPVTVIEYAPRGDDVWGKTSIGWIALRLRGSHYTTWQMETI